MELIPFPRFREPSKFIPDFFNFAHSTGIDGDRGRGLLTRSARGFATVGPKLSAIRRWQDAGLSLERIAELPVAPAPDLAALKVSRPGSVSVRSHVHVAPGIELTVDPELAQLSPERLRALTREVLDAWRRIAGGDAPEKSR